MPCLSRTGDLVAQFRRGDVQYFVYLQARFVQRYGLRFLLHGGHGFLLFNVKVRSVKQPRFQFVCADVRVLFLSPVAH